MVERTKYLEIFRGEAEEHLNSLRDGLLMLEESPGDSDLLQRVMRNAHTLKGTSRMMGFNEIGEIAHRMEDVLKGVERDPQLLRAKVVSLLLEAADYMREVLAAVSAREDPPPIPQELHDRLLSTLGLEARAPEEPGIPADDLGKSLQAILGEGEDVGKAPPRREKRKATTVVINLDRNLNTIRVDVPVLDRLTDLVGELSINRAKLGNKIHQAREVARRVDSLLESASRRGKPEGSWRESVQEVAAKLNECVQRAGEDLDEIAQLLREIQDETLQMRMLPLSIIFDDFYRLVREHARQAGKIIDLQIDGGEINVDKKVLEEIVSPLIHMVTNAIDHGIEPPEERSARGKPEAGVVSVRATAKGDHVTIEVYDDGRGLDADALRLAAVTRAILTREEADALGDEAAQHLIFRSGFSTQENISGTSGRGVGMDVVRTNVELIKGNIGIESEKGKFTRFILTLPVNYSVLQSLIVESGGEVSVIPLDFVTETLHVDRGRVIRHGGRSRMPYKDETIPLLELGTLLGYGSAAPQETDGLHVVVLTCRDERFGVVVDRILRREEVVVKSVGKFLQGMRLVAGATILRFGDPAIILNVYDLCDTARGTRSEIRPPSRAGRPSRLLVVDDSITARTVQKGILEKAGYAVDLATDGEEALEMIRAGEYDLVVTDVEMPRKDGFELTATLKGDPGTRNIPIVIVTTRADDAEKRKGIEVGARAYITKGTFDQNVLIETVRRLIG